jgi:DNA-binding transcriptional regulator YdaS (Cro superfamily)
MRSAFLARTLPGPSIVPDVAALELADLLAESSDLDAQISQEEQRLSKWTCEPDSPEAKLLAEVEGLEESVKQKRQLVRDLPARHALALERHRRRCERCEKVTREMMNELKRRSEILFAARHVALPPDMDLEAALQLARTDLPKAVSAVQQYLRSLVIQLRQKK